TLVEQGLDANRLHTASQSTIAWVLFRLGFAQFNRGDFQAARRKVERVLEILGSIDNPLLEMNARQLVIGLAHNDLEFDKALRHSERIVEVARVFDDARPLARALGSLGFAEREAGRLLDARKHLTEALTLLQPDDLASRALQSCRLGMVHQ